MPETTLTWHQQVALENALNQPPTRDQLAELRPERITRLCEFLTICVRMSRRSPNPSWWSWHAIWAIQRLERLNYRFPECEPVLIVEGRRAA